MSVKYIFISLGVCLGISACAEKDKGETVTVDEGLSVPISTCVEVNGRTFGKAIDARAFCLCFLPKFYRDIKDDPEKLKLLKQGRSNEIKVESQEVTNQNFQDCMVEASTEDSTARFVMTPRMVEQMKEAMKLKLAGSEIEQTNDLDKYCDCMVNSFQVDFTVKEIVRDDFNQTAKYREVNEYCLKESKK